jgi:hypothetical protein
MGGVNMNKRLLHCNKEVLAVGQAGSIADYKNKLERCFICKEFPFCTGAKQYLQGIIKQQENIANIQQVIK